MKIKSISALSGKNIEFEGKRTARNITSQLTRNNSYSLNEPNQRYITNSIKELSEVPGKKNIEFLLNAASKVKYATNIRLNDAPKNNWKGMLLAAAAAAAAITPLINKDKFKEKVDKISSGENLNKTELEILDQREKLLKLIDLEQIKNETVGSIKDFERNLDYFIISSETTTEQKKYILKRLNFFMSNRYKINPQLKDKKSIAVAEMINDMAIHTPGHKIPNIKAINQKQHGICAAISIVRKKLAYEDKVNYVDSIISELDATDSILVYDRGKLGSGEKVKVEKVPVDFETALANGYRIIDASAMQWMQVAQMTGASSIAFDEYNPFDKENFDVKTDTLFNVKFEDPVLEKAQTYYQALIKAGNILKNYKARLIKNNERKYNAYSSHDKNITTMSEVLIKLKEQLTKLNPNLSDNDIQALAAGILNLKQNYSDKIKQGDVFSYIPNEEDIVKKEKIKNYILANVSTPKLQDEDIEKIFDLTEYYQQLSSENKIKTPSEISRAQTLYDIAAAFRYQMVKGLEEDITLHNSMLQEGIKDRESLIMDTINEVIKKLNTNSNDSKYIIKKLATIFQCSQDKDEILANIYGMKDYTNEVLTEELDEIYKSLAVEGGRRGALLQSLENIKDEIYSGNKALCKEFAKSLGIKETPANVVSTIEKFKAQLENGSKDDYLEIFRKLGNTSQIKYLADLFRGLIEKFSEEGSDELMIKFINANNLTEDSDENAVVEKLDEIGVRINTIGNFLDNAAETFTITDNDNDVIIAATPKDVILKKWENSGIIVSPKKLRELQTHFTKITKDRSKDEFSTRQRKLHDKSLYKFSNSEKSTLREIKENVIPMYSYIKKQLPKVEHDLKDSLEELKRIIGVNNGNYWVHAEGISGLFDNQATRILEYMTGRPHYVTEDVKNAIEKIKTEPYSGISGSSVYHNEPALHDQYIADIKPVKIKTPDGEEVKDVLFHDNTWGAAEMENTWIDSKGLTRTDYSDRRGGTLGYITNEKFQNGNLVERILGDMVVEEEEDLTKSKTYKKLKPIRDIKYKAPQVGSIILQGDSPEAKHTAAEIHDAVFVPSSAYINNLGNFSSKYTSEEAKELIKTAETAGTGWKRTHQDLQKRLYSPFAPKLETEEDYNKLANDDYLKVVLEKIALKQNYQLKGLEPELAKVRNIKDLGKFRSAQKNRALNGFKYAFSKDLNVVDFVTDSFREKESEELDNLLEKLNLNLTEEQKSLIGSSFSFDLDEFDGSAQTTINLLLSSIEDDLNKIIDNENAKKEILKFFNNYFTSKIYFNKSDLSNKKISHLVKFIDREFDPENDTEFVRIYRKIQDMTNEEFKREILPKIKPEDLGIKNNTGYDILKKLKRYEEKAETAFMNTIYYDNFSPDYGQESYKLTYTYNKLTRDDKVLVNHNLSSIYRDMAMDLSYLMLPKLFNKYKSSNIIKYGAYPAYPKFDYLEEEDIGLEFNSFMENITEFQNIIKSSKEQLRNYEISHKLSDYLNKFKDDTIIESEKFNSLNMLLGEFITLNYNDNSVTQAFEAAERAMEIPEGSSFKEYRPHITEIVNLIQTFEKTTSAEDIVQLQEEHRKQLTEIISEFSKIFIQERYRNNLISLCNKYVHELTHNNPTKAGNIQDEIYDSYIKYHILNNPKELLKSYILSETKDSNTKNIAHVYKALLTKALQYAQMADVQEILMNAAAEGIEMSAKTMFGNYSLDIQGVDVPMSSGMVIAQMIHRLMHNNQQETALMLIERFGLGEKYIEYMAENMDFDGLIDMIKNVHSVLSNFKHFIRETDELLRKTREDIVHADYISVIDNTKKEICSIGKKYNLDKNDVEPLLNVFDLIKNNCIQNPNADRKILFDSLVVKAKTIIAEKVQSHISTANSIFAANTAVINLINHIMLNENSSANKQRDIITEKFKQLIDYKTSLINLQPEE